MKLNRILTFSAAAALLASCCCRTQEVDPAIPRDAEIESKVENLLKKMTLEEKVGQMTQLNATAVAKGIDITEAGIKAIKEYKIGSVLNTPGDVAQSPEDYNKFITELNRLSMETMGIPCLYGLDHIHGTSYVAGGTLFPQEINIAATFNREHAYNMGKVTAYESRAANVPWTFSPTMDLGRNPEWPRMWESFGEDAYVNAQMAVAEVHGMQGDDPNHVGPYNIAACAIVFLSLHHRHRPTSFFILSCIATLIHSNAINKTLFFTFFKTIFGCTTNCLKSVIHNFRVGVPLSGNHVNVCSDFCVISHKSINKHFKLTAH